MKRGTRLWKERNQNWKASLSTSIVSGIYADEGGDALALWDLKDTPVTGGHRQGDRKLLNHTGCGGLRAAVHVFSLLPQESYSQRLRTQQTTALN